MGICSEDIVNAKESICDISQFRVGKLVEELDTSTWSIFTHGKIYAVRF
jgi:hypothetical protein